MASNNDLANEHDNDSSSNIKPSPYDPGNSNSISGEVKTNWYDDSFDANTLDEPDSDSEKVSKRVRFKNLKSILILFSIHSFFEAKRWQKKGKTCQR